MSETVAEVIGGKSVKQSESARRLREFFETKLQASPARALLEAILAFFYPECCQICGERRARASEGYVCSNCRKRPGAIRWIEPPICERCGLPFEGEITNRFECSNCRGASLQFSSARAAVVASGLVLEIIHRYKYYGALWFEPFLAELLITKATKHLRREDWDMIIPVPLHPLKMREREFNQAERLARRLARATGIPLNVFAVQRVKNTQTQTMLTRSKRAQNVRGAFKLRPSAQLQGKRIVLVDDVLTTGATTSECAGTLVKGGAREVCVWTLARGL